MRINDAPAGWSSIFVAFLPRHTDNDNTDHDTTGLCVNFGGVVDWKSRQLKPTGQLTTELRKHERENGRFGGAQGMAWFGFCLLSSVCFRSVFSMT